MPRTKRLGSKVGAEASARISPSCAIHHDGAGALAGQARLDVVLQPCVDGQLHVRTGDSRVAVQLAHLASGGVDLDALGAGAAAQFGFHPRLDIVAADLEIGDLEDRIGVAGLFDVIVRDRPDIADDMGEIRTQRVDAAETHLRVHAGQGGRVHGDGGKFIPAQPVGHGHGNEGRAAHDLLAGAVKRGEVEVHDPRQFREHGVDVVGVLAHQRDAVVLLVARQKTPLRSKISPRSGGRSRTLIRFSSASRRKSSARST
jgi:hypothetical protein